MFRNGHVVGVGLREQHRKELTESPPQTVGWLEILADNFLDANEQTLQMLEALRETYPMSLHSVGSSIGSVDPLNKEYLLKLKKLIDRLDPFTVSEHLCWSSAHGIHLHDLFPLPMNEETVSHVSSRVSEIQDLFQRELLIENVSAYTTFPESTMDEPTFITEIATQSGSAILLDINNIFLNAENLDFNASKYIASIPKELVKEFHLAGGEKREGYILDSHSCPVWDEVWQLFTEGIRRFGAVPALIEWDNDIPPLETLLKEVDKATAVIQQQEGRDKICAA